MRLLRKPFGFIIQFYWGDGIAADVPALAYFLLISLAPFLLGVATIGALLTNDDQILQAVTDHFTGTMPPDLAKAITSLLHSTHTNSPWLLALALLGCLWTSSGVVGVIARCANRLLGRDPLMPSLGRLKEMGLALAVLIMVVVMSLVGALPSGILKDTGLPLGGWLLTLGSWVLTFLVLLMVLHFAPRGRLHFKSALVGALPASLGLQVVPMIVGVYVSHSSSIDVARIFFLLVILVLACSLSAQIMLISTGVACRYEKRRVKRSLVRPD